MFYLRSGSDKSANVQTMQSNRTIAVVGAGAVGAYYGGRLAQHGQDVHFLVRSDYQTLKREGWTIRSCDGDFQLRPDQIKVYDDPGKMPRAPWASFLDRRKP